MGTSFFEKYDENGKDLSINTQDFIFYAVDLIINGSETTPADGDYVMLNGLKYVVGGGGVSDQNFKYSDPYRTRIRVHTVTDGAG